MSEIELKIDIDSKSVISKGNCCGIAYSNIIGNVGDTFCIHGKMFRILGIEEINKNKKIPNYILNLSDYTDTIYIHYISNCGFEKDKFASNKTYKFNNISEDTSCVRVSNTGLRTCRMCGETKPISEYYIHYKNGKTPSIRTECKSCGNELSRLRLMRNIPITDDMRKEMITHIKVYLDKGYLKKEIASLVGMAIGSFNKIDNEMAPLKTINPSIYNAIIAL